MKTPDDCVIVFAISYGPTLTNSGGPRSMTRSARGVTSSGHAIRKSGARSRIIWTRGKCAYISRIRS